MSALRPIVLGVIVWGVMTNVVRADPITWADWTAWFVGQNQGSGGGASNLGNLSGTIVTPTQPQPQPGPSITSTPEPQPIVPSGPVISNAAVSPGLNASPMTSVPAVASSSSAPASGSVMSAAAPVDAFINLGGGTYPAASSITSGGAQPWYDSPQITKLFGGQPTAQQQQNFDNTIMQRVQQAFSQSGITVTLTDNPNVSALHTISVVSNTTSSSLPNAIGMTQIGGSGFSFISVSAPSAQTLDQLEWIVAHNISHELMLAFGVPENYDTTGNYLDAKMASFSMMVNPNATFSSAAAQAIIQALAAQNGTSSSSQLGAQGLNGSGSSVPEPTTVAIWALAAAALFVTQRTRSRRAPV
jgi:hypothetical protein